MKIFFKLIKQNKVKERISLIRALKEIDEDKHILKFYLNLIKDLERYGDYEIEVKEILIKKYKYLFLRNGIEITSENESKLDNLIEELDSINLDDIELPKNINEDYCNKIKRNIKSLKMQLMFLKTGKLVDWCIPPYTECPCKNKCTMVNNCFHLGIEHSVVFSCRFARTFEV